MGMDNVNYWRGRPDKSPDNVEYFNGICTGCGRGAWVAGVPGTDHWLCGECMAYAMEHPEVLWNGE